ncbi:MAG: cytochrome c-type biogenesis protein CcmH [Chloroflexota bacterium]|nr:cytochrome c-type biogenesis protein CcmH [Chloroflexota bacterium]
MSRWLPIVAAGCVLALMALGAVLLLGPRTEPTTAERADALAAELRCPDCQGLSVADSPTSSAREIRRQIDELLADGATDDEVRAHFVARYGEWIRLAPSSPLPWVVPFAAVFLGVSALAWWIRSRRPADRAAAPVVDPEQRRRLREEVESLDV